MSSTLSLCQSSDFVPLEVERTLIMERVLFAHVIEMLSCVSQETSAALSLHITDYKMISQVEWGL